MWMIATRFCEYCHRPDIGFDQCPHAIDSRYDCPHQWQTSGTTWEQSVHGNGEPVVMPGAMTEVMIVDGWALVRPGTRDADRAMMANPEGHMARSRRRVMHDDARIGIFPFSWVFTVPENGMGATALRALRRAAIYGKEPRLRSLLEVLAATRLDELTGIVPSWTMLMDMARPSAPGVDVLSAAAKLLLLRGGPLLVTTAVVGRVTSWDVQRAIDLWEGSTYLASTGPLVAASPASDSLVRVTVLGMMLRGGATVNEGAINARLLEARDAAIVASGVVTVEDRRSDAALGCVMEHRVPCPRPTSSTDEMLKAVMGGVERVDAAASASGVMVDDVNRRVRAEADLLTMLHRSGLMESRVTTAGVRSIADELNGLTMSVRECDDGVASIAHDDVIAAARAAAAYRERS